MNGSIILVSRQTMKFSCMSDILFLTSTNGVLSIFDYSRSVSVLFSLM